MKETEIDGVQVSLFDDVDPEEVELYGADSRDDDDIDIEALTALAEAGAHLEQEDD